MIWGGGSSLQLYFFSNVINLLLRSLKNSTPTGLLSILHTISYEYGAIVNDSDKKKPLNSEKTLS
jgi:hypothetical protein